MVVKVKEKFGKTRIVRNIDKSENYMLRRERNARNDDRILTKSRGRQQERIFSLEQKRSCTVNIFVTF